MIQIKTQRLLIRDHLTEDFEGLHKILGDRALMQYIPDLFSSTRHDSQENLRIAMQEAEAGEKRGKFFFAVLSKAGEYLGEIGYTILGSDTNGEHLAELGYFFLKDAWGQGYASEAAAAVIDWGFAYGQVRKFESGCVVDNKASERILRKMGFQQEAYKKEHIFIAPYWRDRIEFGLFRQGLLKRL